MCWCCAAARNVGSEPAAYCARKSAGSSRSHQRPLCPLQTALAAYQYHFATPPSARVGGLLSGAGGFWAGSQGAALLPLARGAEAGADVLLLGGSTAVAYAAKQLLLAKRVGAGKKD